MGSYVEGSGLAKNRGEEWRRVKLIWELAPRTAEVAAVSE